MLDIRPIDIEKRSFEIITGELKQRGIAEFSEEISLIIKRVIHTSADFEYASSLEFSENSVQKAIEALKSGCDIVTDTQMVKAGINKAILESLGGKVHCFIGDEDVASEAKRREVTRSAVSMEKASKLNKPCIFAVGNAPTALIALNDLINRGEISPVLIIGVPVGFVNVIESKELIVKSSIPYIVARGRKGGSNVAAAICNAMLYQIKRYI